MYTTLTDDQLDVMEIDYLKTAMIREFNNESDPIAMLELFDDYTDYGLTEKSYQTNCELINTTTYSKGFIKR